MSTSPRPNPYIVTCPHCGGSLCSRCADLDARLARRPDDPAERQRVDAVRAIHLAIYAHEAPAEPPPASRPLPSDLVEQLGRLVDRADNLHAASLLPLSPQTHVEQLRIGMREIARELRSLVVALGGTDWWSRDVAHSSEDTTS